MDTAFKPDAPAPGKFCPTATNSNSAVLPGEAGPNGTTALEGIHSPAVMPEGNRLAA